MAASRTVLQRLNGYQPYLATFPPQERPAYFEYLVSEAFAHILYLPLFTASDDDPSVPHRVKWRGQLNPVTKAPRGEDATATAHGYCVLIEPTLKTGVNQWTQEFAPCCTHYQSFLDDSGIDPGDIYVVLVAPQLHTRTWESIRQVRINWILITVADLARVLLTSLLAFTLTHVQIRQLLTSLIHCGRSSDTLEECAERSNLEISNWQLSTLLEEKETFLAVRSYRAMRGIGHTHIGVGQIIERLRWDPVVKQYIKLARTSLRSDVLEEALLHHGLACSAGRTPPGETLLCPVSGPDITHRQARIMTVLEEIDG